MNSKLVFFDVDGTLASLKDCTVSESALRAIKMAQANGHKCFVNTGRGPTTIDRELREAGFDGYLCGCGTNIEYHGEILYDKQVDHDFLMKFVREAFKYNADVLFEGTEATYYPAHPVSSQAKFLLEQYTPKGFPNLFYDENNYEMIRANKFGLYHTSEREVQPLVDMMKGKFEIIWRDATYYENIPIGHSKGTAIEYIVRYLGADMKDTIAFGDSYNDMPMFLTAHTSVLMGNGDEGLDEHVTFRTTDEQEDGIYNAMKRLELI